jgi:hypothetical protein
MVAKWEGNIEVKAKKKGQEKKNWKSALKKVDCGTMLVN